MPSKMTNAPWTSPPRIGVSTVLVKCMLIDVPTSITSSITILKPKDSWTMSTVPPKATTASDTQSNPRAPALRIPASSSR